jgi:shikimate dehydrogenase
MLENLSGETRLFPIIGDPIIFVKIPPRLTGDLEARGHNGICVPMQVPETDLEGVMNGLSRIPNIDGLLITMPHKFTAFAYCATSSERCFEALSETGPIGYRRRGLIRAVAGFAEYPD